MKTDIESFFQKTPFFRLFLAFTTGILFHFSLVINISQCQRAGKMVSLPAEKVMR